MKLPKKLQSVLWSVNIDHLNLEKDKYYIIHQILSFGTLDEMSWLLSNYSKKKIIEVFMVSFKDYFRPRFYFVKDALLGLKNWHPDERYYVKNTPRIIG
ncbi:hypothetical protein COY87_03960 [Candidatus Roizmanbacteria bacterium CG_4_10_14_0_8_um_filter_33_9]|uniref:DUF6922 domain-containing protein n=1 Tax=Candidatus Roizmanbacteria bacterium CG_4_10_14_0_8_um_filter_33_9 TaxID=1974826 RepID=A0A2M7QIU0_9BACT|nr:MAG: hypothetical protein COY87_03960 [Candidatus Roizmanbacteria bacterium CG_4_10_14_0_8_um_filter_33_9]